MPRALGRKPATKADIAQMSEFLGERIGNLEKRMDRVEGILQKHSEILEKHSEILETHSKLLTNISRTVDRIEEKLSAPGGLAERVLKLETRVGALERVARRAR